MADAKNKPAAPDYGRMLRELRDLQVGWRASDGYDARRLTPARKAAVTRAWKAQRAFLLTWQLPHHLRVVKVAARSPEKIAEVFGALPVPMDAYPSRWNARLVLAPAPPQATAVSLDRYGGIVYHVPKIEVELPSGNILTVEAPRQVKIDIDPVEMATDPWAIAARVLKEHPHATGFSVRSGDNGWVNNQSGRIHDAHYFYNNESEPLDMRIQELGAVIAMLLHRYGADIGEGYENIERMDEKYRQIGIDLNEDNPAGNYFANWVTGIMAHYIPRPTIQLYNAFLEYSREVSREKRGHRDRANRRRKKGYAQAKGRSR